MAAWSDHPYEYEMYAYLHHPATAFAALVNMATITYPLTSLTFDGVTTGAFGDILPGMTLLLGTSAGADDLGRVRVRTVATSTVIQINRTSRGTRDGELNVSDNMFITVLDDFRVWSKTPRNEGSGTQRRDQVAFSAATAQPPVANAGVGYAEFVNTGTNVITVAFDGSASWAVNSGSSITSYAWSIADGTVMAGATNTATVTCTFPPGFRWVHLTVSDGTRSHTAHVPVFAAEASGSNAPYTSFKIERDVCRTEGHSLDMRVYADIPATTYPDGTLVMLWQREYYNNVLGSLSGTAPTGRAHMWFIGWIQEEEASISAGEETVLRDVLLKCVDVAGRLSYLAQFKETKSRKSSPANFAQMANANLTRLIHHELHWFSTALELADWTNPGALYDFQTFDVSGANLYDACDRLAQAIGYRFTGDTRGRLRLVVDPQLQNTGDRTSTVIRSLAESDWRDIKYSSTRHPRAMRLKSKAQLTSSTNASRSNKPRYVYTALPGSSDSQGAQDESQGGGLVISQTEHNAREGHRYAVRINFRNGVFNVLLAHAGDYVSDAPALMQWIRATISTTNAAQRGLAFTNERFLCLEVQIEHDFEAGTKTQRLILEREASGTAGTAYTVPNENLNGIVGGVTLPPLYWDFPPLVLPDPINLPRGTVRMGAALRDGIALTIEFGTSAAAGGPDWATLWANTTTLGLLSSIQDAITDPEGYLSGNTVTIYAACDEHIYKITVSTAGVMTATLLYTFANPFDANLSNRNIEMLFAPGVIVVVSYYDNAAATPGVYYIVSTDYGATWGTETALTTNANTQNVFLCPGLSPALTAGTFTTSTITGATGVTPTFTGRQTVNSGGAWSALAGITGKGLAGSIHFPRHNNPGNAIYFHGAYDYNAGSPISRLFRSGVDVSPDVAGVKFGPMFNRAIDSCPVNGSRVAGALRSRNIAVGASDPAGVFVSITGGVSASDFTRQTIDTGATAYYVLRWMGDNPDGFYLAGIAEIAQTFDLGVTLDDQTGNLASVTSQRVLNLFGW